MPQSVHRAALPLLLIVLLVVGCGGAATPTPSDRRDPIGSPLPSLDATAIAVCEATVVIEDGIRRLREVQPRRSTAIRLEEAFETVQTGRDMLMERYPSWMRTRVRTLDIAITNMALAVEDLETVPSARVDATVANIRARINGLRRAVTSFRSWLGCDPQAADASIAPDASGAAVGASILPSAPLPSSAPTDEP